MCHRDSEDQIVSWCVAVQLYVSASFSSSHRQQGNCILNEEVSMASMVKKVLRARRHTSETWVGSKGRYVKCKCLVRLTKREREGQQPRLPKYHFIFPFICVRNTKYPQEASRPLVDHGINIQKWEWLGTGAREEHSPWAWKKAKSLSELKLSWAGAHQGLELNYR